MIFITHDLGLVADMPDRALVMLRGRVVESGPVKSLFTNPQHPYTRGLLMCRPALHVKGERLPVVSDYLEEFNRLSDDLIRKSDPKLSQSIRYDPVIKQNPKPEKPNDPPVKEREILLQVTGLRVRYRLEETVW